MKHSVCVYYIVIKGFDYYIIAQYRRCVDVHEGPQLISAFNISTFTF